MLRKTLVSFVSVLLFVFVQAGFVTHEISHFQDFIKHSQQDKNTSSEYCAQCLTMAHADGAMPGTTLGFHLPMTVQVRFVSVYLPSASCHHSVYAARAPPISIYA